MQRKILRFPHPWFWFALRNAVHQPFGLAKALEGADMPAYQREDVTAAICDDFGMPADTPIIDGVRAADSIVRRAAITKHGPHRRTGYLSLIWDWRISHVRSTIADAGVKLPPDYEWFGRSFDGLDIRFTGPLKANAPDDYQRILHFFPYVEVEQLRHQLERPTR